MHGLAGRRGDHYGRGLVRGADRVRAWGRPGLRERRSTVADVHTRVLEVPGEGAPFLLLQGYSDSADTWRPLLRELALRGRPALAVDLPAFGAGPMLPHLDRFVAQLVRDAASDGEHPVIVGNSLGAVAALRAAQDPDLPLGGAVAVSPAGLGHQPWVDLFERDPILHRIVSARLPLPGPLIRWAVRTVYPRLAVHDASRLDPEVVTAYASHYRGRADVVRIVRDARRLLGELRAAYDLSRICRPVRLIWGSRDLLTPRRGAQSLLDAVPEAELVVLDRCGHCAQVEQPERVADVVVAFGDEVGGPVREHRVEW